MKSLTKNKYLVPLITVVIVNTVLFVTKLYISIKTNSLCVYTDSINNLLDALSSLLACASSVYITREATLKHPFGFGRLEYILELIMSIIIALAGLYFAYNSIARLIMPTPVWFYINFAYILAASCVVKLVLSLIFMRLYKKSGSVLFKTIALDSLLDFFVTLVTIISFSLSNSTGVVLDGFLGLLISIIIAASGIKLVFNSVSKLIGSTDSCDIDKIKAIINGIDEELTIKDILIDDYGTKQRRITVVLKSSNKNKSKLQSELKQGLEKGNYQRAYIVWEE